MKILLKGMHVAILESLIEAFPEHTFYVQGAGISGITCTLAKPYLATKSNFKGLGKELPNFSDYDLFIGHVEGSPMPNCQPISTKDWKIPKIWLAWYTCGKGVFPLLKETEPVLHTTFQGRTQSIEWAKLYNVLTKNIEGPQFYPYENPSIYHNYNGKIKSGLMVVTAFNLRKTFGKNIFDKMENISPTLPIKVIGDVSKEGAITVVPFEELLSNYRNYKVYLDLVEEGRPMSCSFEEAMMTGMPVIAVNQGDYPIVLRQGVEGFLVDKTKPKEILDALNTLIENENQAIEMGRRSRQRALTIFDEWQFRLAFEEAFDFALGKQSKWYIDQEAKKKFYMEFR